MKHGFVIFTLCALITVAPAAHADNASLRAQIATFYTQKDAAERTNNYAAWKALVVKNVLPTFTLTDSHGKVTPLPKLLSQLKDGMHSGIKPSVDRTTLISVTAKGLTATEISTSIYASPFRDTHKKNDTTHIYGDKATQSVKWVNVNGVWKAASVIITKDVKTIDGKPLPSH